jgi:hypothetical protein
MARLDRYTAAVMLAQEILQANPARDELMIMEAIDDLIDEVRAGRRNQAEYMNVVAQLEKHGLCSLRVEKRTHLSLVTPDEFDDLVREGA